MKRAGRATIFEIGDMIGMPGTETSALMPTAYGTERSLYVRSVPLPFRDGLFARFRAAWEVICGRAYPVCWPEPGDLEKAVQYPLFIPHRGPVPLTPPRRLTAEEMRAGRGGWG
jgi:hypothetical protein